MPRPSLTSTLHIKLAKSGPDPDDRKLVFLDLAEVLRRHGVGFSGCEAREFDKEPESAMAVRVKSRSLPGVEITPEITLDFVELTDKHFDTKIVFRGLRQALAAAEINVDHVSTAFSGIGTEIAMRAKRAYNPFENPLEALVVEERGHASRLSPTGRSTAANSHKPPKAPTRLARSSIGFKRSNPKPPAPAKKAYNPFEDSPEASSTALEGTDTRPLGPKPGKPAPASKKRSADRQKSNAATGRNKATKLRRTSRE